MPTRKEILRDLSRVLKASIHSQSTARRKLYGVTQGSNRRKKKRPAAAESTPEVGGFSGGENTKENQEVDESKNKSP